MKDPGLGVHGWRLVAPALLRRLCAKQQLLEKQRVCGEKRRETAEDFDVLPRRILRLSLSSLNLTAWMGPPLKSVFSSSHLMFTTHVQVMRRIKKRTPDQRPQ